MKYDDPDYPTEPPWLYTRPAWYGAWARFLRRWKR